MRREQNGKAIRKSENVRTKANRKHRDHNADIYLFWIEFNFSFHILKSKPVNPISVDFGFRFHSFAHDDRFDRFHLFFLFLFNTFVIVCSVLLLDGRHISYFCFSCCFIVRSSLPFWFASIVIIANCYWHKPSLQIAGAIYNNLLCFSTERMINLYVLG